MLAVYLFTETSIRFPGPSSLNQEVICSVTARTRMESPPIRSGS